MFKIRLSIYVFFSVLTSLFPLHLVRCEENAENIVKEVDIFKPLYEKPLADPFLFKEGNYYYIFGTSLDFLQTRTFERNEFKLMRFELDIGQESKRAGASGTWSFRIYKHVDGSYHGYGSINYGEFRTAIGHFVPKSGEVWTDEHPILKWRLVNVLVGNVDLGWIVFDSEVYRDENGVLYLVYNSGHPNEFSSVDVHIKVRRLIDPGTLDPTFPPRTLLSPEGYRSEDRNENYFQLTEGTHIRKIGGKYVLIYNAGAFEGENYKIGLAYSDTLIPPEGSTYKKLLVPDPENLWGNEGKDNEILYLLQSQKKDWPNYCGDLVNGPGIGDIFQNKEGQYYLVFHGRKPGVTGIGNNRYLWKFPLEVDFSPEKSPNDWIRVVLPDR